MARNLDVRPEKTQAPLPASALNILEWDEGGASIAGWFGVEIKYRDCQFGEQGTYQRSTLRVVVDDELPPKR